MRGRVSSLAVRRSSRTRIANPALYRLMFSAALTSPEAGRPAIEKAAGAKARAIVDETLADAVRSGALPSSIANPREAAAASLAMWSLLHGLAMLAIDDFVGPPQDVETLVEPFLGRAPRRRRVTSAGAPREHLDGAAALALRRRKPGAPEADSDR